MDKSGPPTKVLQHRQHSAPWWEFPMDWRDTSGLSTKISSSFDILWDEAKYRPFEGSSFR